jgi:tetratricopeptide (TPR) repeat protein
MRNYNSIILLAVLAVVSSGAANAQSVPINKAATTIQQPPSHDSEYVVRGSGVIGLNRPLPGTSPPVVSSIGPIEVAASDSFCRIGEAESKKGNWTAAMDNYHKALNLWPDSREALYLATEAAVALGDTTLAARYCRAAVHTDNPFNYGAIPDDGFQENDIKRLMQFALLLNQVGQTAEAMSLYNRAAYLRDYQDSQFHGGKPYLKVLLPELVEERLLPEQVRYTPERLQALADTALAHEELGFGSDKEALAHMQEAVKLFPESPVTHFYLGEALSRKDPRAAKAAYRKAAELGDAGTRAAANDRLGVSK